MLDKTISVIQCHILFDDERGRKRLEHQKSFKGIPSFVIFMSIIKLKLF